MLGSARVVGEQVSSPRNFGRKKSPDFSGLGVAGLEIQVEKFFVDVASGLVL